MGMFTLTVLDTSGIQAYIFGTNNLRQNVGASYLVDSVTGLWVKECLDELGLRHNLSVRGGGLVLLEDRRIERGELDAELIYSGGGNAVILFQNPDPQVASCPPATGFAQALTRKALLESPGLQVIVAHQDFDWDHNPLGGDQGVLQSAMQTLAKHKASPQVSCQTYALAITAACIYTGKAATGLDEDRRPVSVEVIAKTRAAARANRRLSENFKSKFDYPLDFDHLGGTQDESSYIAVIHTDGNGMGKRVRQISAAHAHPGAGNRDYIQAQRAFSDSIARAATTALRNTVRRLEDSVEYDSENRPHIGGVVYLKENSLPFRPLVFGGDDVTFVCDGRLGLSLTAYYLQQLSAQRLSDGDYVHCRAGVAIVKTHYPFSRAYTLAEDLCASARNYIQQAGGALTAMDWHFAKNGMVLSLKQIRRREYHLQTGRLNMTPVWITAPEAHWRSWDTFTRTVTAFQASQEWSGRRNKVKALREALRAGPESVRHFLKLYEVKDERLPALAADGASWQTTAERDGWLPAGAWDQDNYLPDEEPAGQICAYFDPIEALDFFVPLKGA
ncbi:MAG: hypothetical protein GYA17_00790 [Chloroflexi bacterium]|nr:hypothetical protein [Chloroflexota bacterium]